MKILILSLLLLTILHGELSYPKEEHHVYWHVGCSLISFFGTHYIIKKTCNNCSEKEILSISIPLGLFPGLMKEIYDKEKYNSFSMEDIGYNSLGVLFGVYFITYF